MAGELETCDRLRRGYLSLERLERDRFIAADPELGKQTEWGIIHRELLELELQDFDDQLDAFAAPAYGWNVRATLSRQGREACRMLPRFEILEHTADVRVRAFGETLPGLFENAALGVQFLALDAAGVKAVNSYELEATGEDFESLFVNWLTRSSSIWTESVSRWPIFR